jgi:hypothetical protein
VALPKGTGTLTVSAIPWGDVYISGKKLGRAPGSWTVPAGKYKLLVKGPDDQERVKVITIDNDETERHDFTFEVSP